jgi:hypothetical protein
MQYNGGVQERLLAAGTALLVTLLVRVLNVALLAFILRLQVVAVPTIVATMFINVSMALVAHRVPSGDTSFVIALLKDGV